MKHYIFVLFNFIITGIIFLIDRKNLEKYFSLGAIAMLADLFFEQIPISGGFWEYNSNPKLFGFSVYMWILYLPYMTMCYFIGSKILEKNG